MHKRTNILFPKRRQQRNIILLFIIVLFSSCNNTDNISFNVIDTDFSKGRIGNNQVIDMDDLEKLHGHLCDGLVEGALALKLGLKTLFPNDTIDRTDLQIVSNPSPCLTDAAIYITGGRYQYNSFYVDPSIDGLYIIKRKEDKEAIIVKRKKNVKPKIIDELGNLAIQQKLSPCGIDSLRLLEDRYMKKLLNTDLDKLFTIEVLTDFQWEPRTKYDYIKSDIINKNLKECSAE